ncbi:hypothetical protein CPC08DRAFT_278120 [Agrocybe pediades]|nr:hypothetical protein CPC08DRAFT_278120 [Agrocybe pediades]
MDGDGRTDGRHDKIGVRQSVLTTTRAYPTSSHHRPRVNLSRILPFFLYITPPPSLPIMPRERSMSGTIPSMETSHDELKDNTIISLALLVILRRKRLYLPSLLSIVKVSFPATSK